MPYAITTKDGITIQGIPDSVDPNSPALKERVEQIRLQRSGTRSAAAASIPVGPGDRGPRPVEMTMDQAPTAPAEPGFGAKIVGTGEAALAGLTGATTGTVGMLLGGASGIVADIRGIAEQGTAYTGNEAKARALGGAAAGTYAPRTESGQAQAQALGEAAQNLVPLTGLGAQGAMLAQATRGMAPAAAAHAQSAQASVSQAVARTAERLSQKRGGMPDVAPVQQPGAAMPAQAVPQVAKAIPAEQTEQAFRTAAMGGFGAEKATKRVVQAADLDPETVAASERLGVLGDMPVEALSRSQSFRQSMQLVKSQPGSEAMQLQTKQLDDIAGKTRKIVADLGADDVSTTSAATKAKLEELTGTMKVKEDALYESVRKGIKPTERASADSTRELLRTRVRELGGDPSRLEPQEIRLLRQLDTEKAPVTYGLLDATRKQIGAAMERKESTFGTTDSGMLKQLYAALTKDQERAALAAGQEWNWKAAKYATTLRKGNEERMQALFGDKLDKSMAPLITGSIKKLGQGDESSFVKMVASVPKDMRQQVVASGLDTFFTNKLRSGDMDFYGYSKWHDGLAQNKQAYAALMSSLPKETAKQLADLAKVAKGIALAKGEFISTGKSVNPKLLAPAETMSARIFDEVKRWGIRGAVAEGVGTASGLPGMASGIMSAMSKNKPSIAKAADALIVSPEFIEAVKAANTPAQKVAVRKFVASEAFKKFAKQAPSLKDLPLPKVEAWVLESLAVSGATQAAIQQGEKE